MRQHLHFLLAVIFAAMTSGLPVLAHADTPKIGIVVMHGKGGSPKRYVNVLADELVRKGMLVANLDMPWSKSRDYDVATEKADAEILAALADLKSLGAQKFFVAGHSMGGAFAVHFGAMYPIDGIVAIAPGGSTAAPAYFAQIEASLTEARALIAAGRGKEKVALLDYENSRGKYPINTTPENFVSWFDPAGAMNMTRALQDLKAPILWLVATRDYPGLRKSNLPAYQKIPPHPLNRLYEPDSDHLNAPAASTEEIAAWTAAVAGAR